MAYVQIQKNRGRGGRELVYVHVAGSRWDRRKKRSKQERFYIGRLDADTGDVILSKGLGPAGGGRVALAEVRARAENGEDVEAWLRMRGRPDAPPAGSADTPAQVHIVGDVHLLRFLAQETGLEPLLADIYGPAAGAALLGLAMHQTVEGRPLYLAADWLSERELPEPMRGPLVTSERVYGLIAQTGADCDSREEFFRGWIARHGGPRAVLCDTTSISTYSRELELAEYGYNRDGDDLPQINLCMALNSESGLPLWCRLLPGSIPDVSSLAATAELLRDFGMDSFRVSLDRGFYSEANLRDLIGNGLDFVIGVPFSVVQARRLVARSAAALRSPKRSFQYEGRVMRHLSTEWLLKAGQGQNRTLEAHIFLDPQRREERIAAIEKAVFDLENKAAAEDFTVFGEARRWLNENAGRLARLFRVAREGDRGPVITRKPRAVAQAVSRMGYTVVLTTVPGQTPSQVLAEYRSRDRVEKIFDGLKNENGQRRLHTGVDSSVEGRIILAFLALVLRAELENRMRSAGLLRKMTTAEALAGLRKIKAVTTRSGKRILLEVPKRQRTLLATLGVPLPE
jgi:transposase